MSEALKIPPQAVIKNLRERLDFLYIKKLEFNGVLTACKNEIKQIENYIDALNHKGEYHEDKTRR